MRLLLVEDDRKLSRVLARGLREEGFQVEVAADGEAGLARLRARESDVVVLDGRLPVLDGFRVLATARAEGISTPVVMLTALDQTSDRVRGLNLGADDYLVKPFAFDELLARIQAVMRRVATPPLEKPSSRLRHGDLELDSATHRVTRAGTAIELSQKQFALLEFLMRAGEQVVSRDRILLEVWGYTFDPGTNVIDVHVAVLRQKIDELGAPSRIRTVRGVGYSMSGAK